MNKSSIESGGGGEDLAANVVEQYRNHPASSLETYEYFNQDKQILDEFSQALLDGENIQAPRYTYDKLDVDTLLGIRDELTVMLAQLPNDRLLTLEETLIRQSITMRVHEVGIMLLTKMQSELKPDEDVYEKASFQLGMNMREVYGLPDAVHFRGILGYRLSKISGIEFDDVPDEVGAAWRYVRGQLPDNLPVIKPYQMQADTKEWYASQLNQRLKPAIEAVDNALTQNIIQLDESAKLDSNAIVEATRTALDARGFSEWRVAKTTSTGIDTRQSDKTIYIPESRVMSMAEFTKVIQSHEIDVHVARRVNGDASGVPILQGTGASGYLAYEEGNGKVNEALLGDSLGNEQSAFGYFLTAGLIAGLDRNGRGRNFRETHKLVWRLAFIEKYMKTGACEEADKVSQVFAATRHVNRLFRGTDGTVPGVFFPKDSMTYYLGGVKVMRKWDADMSLSEEQRLEQHRLERSAKIYPLDSAHIELVRQAQQNHPYTVS